MLEFHDTLREANIARDIEWTGGREVSYTFRAAELHGECAEVGELFLIPPGEALPGATPARALAWLGGLAEEIGDGLITVDLVGMKLGFHGIPHEADVDPHFVQHYGKRTTSDLLAILGVRTGSICNTLKKLEREALGWVGSRAKPEDAWGPLFEVHCILREFARRYAIDASQAVRAKFNRTSEKNGLRTRLG